MSPTLSPLLAVGLQELVGLIIVVVMFINWVVQKLAAKGPPMAPPVQRPGRNLPPLKDRLQDEIDVFLQDLKQGRAPQGQPREGDAANRQRTPQRPPPVPQRQPSAEKSRRQSKPNKPQPTARPQEKPVAEKQEPRQSVFQANLGEIQQHVNQYLPKDAIAKEVQQDLGQGLQAEVAAHLGRFQAGASQPAQTSGSLQARAMKTLLRNPRNFKQAILINELLAKPKALR